MMLSFFSCVYYLSIFLELNYALKYFAHFKNWLFLFLLLSFDNFYVFYICILCQMEVRKTFSSSAWLVFIFLTMSFEKQKFLILRSSIYQLFVLWIMLLGSYLRNLCQTQVTKIFSCVFLFYTSRVFFSFILSYVSVFHTSLFYT